MKARAELVVAAALALLPTAAAAQGIAGRFSIAAQIGTQSEVAGDMLSSATGTLERQVSIDSQRYRDIYAPDLRLSGLLGFGVGDKTEVIARVTYYKTEAVTGLEAGTMDGQPLYVYFPSQEAPDSYEEVGFELGLRYYISAQARLKSYVAPIVGVRFVNEALVSFSAPAVGISVQNIPFSQEGTLPVFGLDIGFTFDLGENAFVGLDTGLRYQPAPVGFDFLPGFTTIDDSQGRWSAPVVAMIGFRF
jgi:hypothetical protein